MNVGHLIDTYGYWAVFILVAAESLGVPVPGETALIVAGTYAGHTHKLSPWVIFLVASAAAIIGDNIGFWIGDKGGYPLARRYGHVVRFDEHKLKIARYVFEPTGPKWCSWAVRVHSAYLRGVSRRHQPDAMAQVSRGQCRRWDRLGRRLHRRRLLRRQRPPTGVSHH